MPRKEDQWNRQGEHCVDGPESCNISSYKLSSTDQDRERRNFSGYEKHTPAKDLMDAISCEGTTETRGGKSMNHTGYSGIELPRRFK